MNHKVFHVLITGASNGIGASLALQYAKNGKTLSLIARNESRLNEIVKKCQSYGAQVTPYIVDVNETDALQQTIADIDRKNPIDLVIANAGVTSNIGPNGEEEPWSDVKHLVNTNLLGAMATLSPLISPMRKRGQGQMAVVSSLAAYRGLPITPAYCASKAGIKAYGEALRGLLRNDGVGVSVVMPGFVISDMSDKFPGKKPFMITSEKAAEIIEKGITKNKARISFPFPLNVGTWFLSLLPASIADFLLDKLSYGTQAE